MPSDDCVLQARAALAKYKDGSLKLEDLPGAARASASITTWQCVFAEEPAAYAILTLEEHKQKADKSYQNWRSFLKEKRPAKDRKQARHAMMNLIGHVAVATLQNCDPVRRAKELTLLKESKFPDYLARVDVYERTNKELDKIFPQALEAWLTRFGKDSLLLAYHIRDANEFHAAYFPDEAVELRKLLDNQR